jgi:O-antigen ligase
MGAALGQLMHRQGLPVQGAHASVITQRMTAFLCYALLISFLLPSNLAALTRLAPVAYVSFGVIIWGLKVKGWPVLSRTILDWFFLAWFFLAVASHAYAGSYLGRILFINDFIDYSFILIETWITYRAALALVVVAPKTATTHLVRALLLGIGFAAFVGLLQFEGSTKSFATSFAMRFGHSPEQVEHGLLLESPRPAAIFSSPVIFGYVCTIGMTIVCGILIGMRKRVGEIKTPLLAGLIVLFLAGCFVAQTRQGVLIAGILMAIFVVFMLRMKEYRKALIVIVSGIALIAGLITVKGGFQFDYLTSSLSTGLNRDESYNVRKEAINNIHSMAPQLAVLGAGFTRGSMIPYFRKGDYFNRANGPDNTFYQAFLFHGVPGLIHLTFLFVGMIYMVRQLRPRGVPWIENMKWIAGLLILVFLLSCAASTRHCKSETMIFVTLIFGAVGGLLYHQRKHERLQALGVLQPPAEAKA